MPSRSPPPDAEKKEETKKDMGYVLVYMFVFIHITIMLIKVFILYNELYIVIHACKNITEKL